MKKTTLAALTLSAALIAGQAMAQTADDMSTGAAAPVATSTHHDKMHKSTKTHAHKKHSGSTTHHKHKKSDAMSK